MFTAMAYGHAEEAMIKAQKLERWDLRQSICQAEQSMMYWYDIETLFLVQLGSTQLGCVILKRKDVGFVTRIADSVTLLPNWCVDACVRAQEELSDHNPRCKGTVEICWGFRHRSNASTLCPHTRGHTASDLAGVVPSMEDDDGVEWRYCAVGASIP